ERILEGTQRHLQALYTALVQPFIDKIETPHITIIPHGMLHFLPFHAFFDGTQYMIDRFEFSYAPSASVLRYCQDNPEVTGATPLIVGVADEQAPMVEDEVKALGALFPDSRVISGEQA